MITLFIVGIFDTLASLHLCHRRNLRRGVRWVPVPPLFDLRVPYPHISGGKGEEFAVTCFSRSGLRRLNHNKNRFQSGLHPGPRWESVERVIPTHSPLLSSQDPRAPRSPSELVPRILDQSHAPAWLYDSISKGTGSEMT